MIKAISRLPDEPIMVVQLEGHVSLEDAFTIFEETTRAFEGHTGRIYRITDATLATSSFHDMLAIIQEAGKKYPASTTDPNLTALLVGNNQWVKMVQEGLRQEQFGATSIHIFPSYEEALEFARVMIESNP